MRLLTIKTGACPLPSFLELWKLHTINWQSSRSWARILRTRNVVGMCVVRELRLKLKLKHAQSTRKHNRKGRLDAEEQKSSRAKRRMRCQHIKNICIYQKYINKKLEKRHANTEIKSEKYIYYKRKGENIVSATKWLTGRMIIIALSLALFAPFFFFVRAVCSFAPEQICQSQTNRCQKVWLPNDKKECTSRTAI